METDIKRFLELACEFDENYTMTKYVVQRILGGQQEHDPRGRATVASGCVSEICAAWNLEEIYEKWRLYRQRMKCKRKNELCPETGAQFIDVTFPVKRLKDHTAGTPKCVLNKFCDEQNLDRPIYKTAMRDGDKRYISTIDVMGKKFRSRFGQPNKKMAEQVAALSALIGLDLRHILIGNWEEG
ncbi:unnamed protein product, partial [Mesorhabditis belari]|uniref:DRBM domain-containing protein n=1 Tax=Mesorhabditis belari TaxID=2138241 RepID=A0AAF3F3Z7_9BILA